MSGPAAADPPVTGSTATDPPVSTSAAPPDPSDPHLTFGRFLADVAERHGDRVAVVSEARSFTYAELRAEVRALARALVGAGVAKGARVALWMANSPEWIVSAYAIGSIGAVLVPVNTFARGSERDHILRHSDASLLLLQPNLGEQRFLDDLRGARPGIADGLSGSLREPALPQLRRVVCLGESPCAGVDSWESLLARGTDVSDTLLDAVTADVDPCDDGLIIYTSGTTSLPKGVLHTQRAAVLQGHRFADMLRFTEADRLYTTYPFFWTAGIAMSIGGAFAAGARLLVQERFEPGAALDMIERERATAVHAWPHQHKALGEHESAARRDLSCIDKMEPSSPLAALAGIEKDVYGAGASYGLSETFTICSALPADAPAERRHACSGRPWPGMELRIVDPETGAPRAPGEEGEIAVRGVTLMRGYYKVAPERVFDAEGWFRTSDGGSIDADGYLHWTGRLSNLIKTGGANVSPVEIQEQLESHPELKLGIPVGIEHPTLGEVIVLCAVAVEGAQPTEAGVRVWLRERLAAYKVPKRVLFFGADELSYTGNQKVQVEPLAHAALRRLEEEGAEVEGHRYASVRKGSR
jgi:acyl-CoA synthetase (AMP-forming)/AMP-acid ligase II